VVSRYREVFSCGVDMYVHAYIFMGLIYIGFIVILIILRQAISHLVQLPPDIRNVEVES
jgi:hypothetical protein